MINVWAKLILQFCNRKAMNCTYHTAFSTSTVTTRGIWGGGREGGDSGGDMMILVKETWLLSSWSVASCQPHWDT